MAFEKQKEILESIELHKRDINALNNEFELEKLREEYEREAKKLGMCYNALHTYLPSEIADATFLKMFEKSM